MENHYDNFCHIIEEVKKVGAKDEMLICGVLSSWISYIIGFVNSSNSDEYPPDISEIYKMIYIAGSWLNDISLGSITPQLDRFINESIHDDIIDPDPELLSGIDIRDLLNGDID